MPESSSPDLPAQVALRLPPSLIRRIESRRGQVGLSRNEWIKKALEWALDQPVKEVRVVSKV